MTGFEIFWPIVGQVVLVFILYGLLGYRRRRMVRQGKIRISEYRENRDEPPESLFVKNSIANQFELPVLFYVCCVLLYITEAANLPSLVLAWLFVVLRYAHAYVHVTSNNMRIRSPLFALGCAALLGMWGWLIGWMAFSG
jgi:hypothetical protein